MIGDFFGTSMTSGDLMFLATGAVGTLLLTGVAVAAGTVLGVVLGIIRAERGIVVNGVLGLFVDILRSVPVLIQLIVFNSFVSIIGYPLSAFQSGVVVLSLFMAANCTEVVRAGVQSVRKEVRRAGRSIRDHAARIPGRLSVVDRCRSGHHERDGAGIRFGIFRAVEILTNTHHATAGTASDPDPRRRVLLRHELSGRAVRQSP